jgi:hypothetical protein
MLEYVLGFYGILNDKVIVVMLYTSGSCSEPQGRLPPGALHFQELYTLIDKRGLCCQWK